MENGKFDGKLEYYSNFDTIPKEKISTREIEFSFLQKIKDNAKYVDYKFNKSNELEFEYYDFENLSMYGYIREVVTIDMIVDGNEMTRILESLILVDNNNPTENPFDVIGWSKIK